MKFSSLTPFRLPLPAVFDQVICGSGLGDEGTGNVATRSTLLTEISRNGAEA